MLNRRFGRVVVLAEAEPQRDPNGRVRRAFQIRCDCGEIIVAEGYALRSGNTQSCGCLQRETVRALSTIHGDAARKRLSPSYVSYCGMLQRCRDPNHERYGDYGGRGITVCSRWLVGEDGLGGYECFKADMGPRPSRRYSIERRNNDGAYEPGNCFWATSSEQQRNKRHKFNVPLNGETIPLTRACELLGLKPNTVRKRLARGLSPTEALKP